MLFRSLMLSAVAIFTMSAQAQNQGGPPPGAMPPAPKYMLQAGGIGTIGFVNDSPTIGLAYIPFDHTLFALGLGMKYNGNGLTVPNTNPPMVIPDKWSWDLVIAAEYALVDRFPFSMGPQMTAIFNFFPGDSLANTILMPGWGFWYAPFNAPVGIGSALAMQIVLTKNRDPVVSLVTPGLRLVYVF